MNPFLSVQEQELIDIMKSFANTPVENLAPSGHKKYVLNKLRWIPIDFGISHFKLCYPPMPIMDLIQIGASLQEHITKNSVIDESTFYQILAARNILRLLNRAYDFNEDIKRFYDMDIERILSSIEDDNFIYDENKLSTLPTLLQRASMKPTDSLKTLTDFILSKIEPILDLTDNKSNICEKLINGTIEEQDILFAYDLYYLLFPRFFSWKMSTPFSGLFLNEKYKKKRFRVDYDTTPIDEIREYTQMKGCDK